METYGERVVRIDFVLPRGLRSGNKSSPSRHGVLRPVIRLEFRILLGALFGPEI